ncbi:MAG: Twin-arginine translocation pathway signal [Frankiales bacterium]|nr:Twin-arginine translocation pathway signal [Frankiales bacterium]
MASVLTGLLLAVAAFPIVGGLGLTAKAGAEEFLVLPDELKTSPLAERTRILASDGTTELAVLYRENRLNAALADIPELARKAVIATEDSRFYAHNGVDYKGTARAALENVKARGVSQGGSTLTQQYVKNALLQAARGSREQQAAARELSIDRKLKEARYALAIEKELSKDQILERYLNIAYYGNGVYGMGTAANFYFSKPVQQLTLAEGALLAGIVQTPSKFDPVKAIQEPSVMATLLARRDTVLTRMVDVGFISEAERAAASAERGTAGGKSLFAIQPVTSGCENPEVKAPFFCDYLRRALEDTDLGKALGNTREERQDKLLAGGLTIVTTLDPKIQESAQAAADENVPRDDPFGAGAVVDIVEPGTGKVKAMAVNRTYSELKQPGHTKVNLAIGGSAGFQPGSTFKAFVLAEAIKEGIPLGLTLYAPVQYQSKECTTNDPKNGNKRIPYAPKNAGDSEAGTFDLRTATHHSVNTYYIQILDRTGVPAVAAMADSLGVRQFVNGAPTGTMQRPGGGKYEGCAIVLGADNVSPLDMAGAYATFAARGLYCKPTPVIEIRDAKGQPINLGQPGCTQVLEPFVADTVNSVLTGVIDGRGTGTRASIGRPAAGKTGTTNGSTAAWFIGYTPQLATAVWIGDPGGPNNPVDEMVNVRINGQRYSQVYGGTIPAVIFKQAMTGALKGVPVVPFTEPGEAAVRGRDIVVPDVRGMPLAEAEAMLIGAGFSVRNGGRVAAAPVPNGAAAYTSPRAGRPLGFGETVTLYSSSGRSASGGAPASPAPPSAPAPEPAVEPAALAPEPVAAAREPGRGNGNGNGNGNGRTRN